MQLRELREYCARRGWGIAAEYVDVGISGAKERRPRLDELMRHAHRHNVSVVIVWRFDRMARSVSHLIRVLETFQALGIDFISLSEAIDTSTPAGKMTFTVLGAVAELERRLIVERVKAGLRNAQAKGKKLGRPKRILNSSGFPHFAHRASAGRRSRRRWAFGVGTVLRHGGGVPKLRKGILERIRCFAELRVL
jgi:DNA invertase Pin-like site-specific DNA recombinase